jgi:hypothetical protein
LTMVLCKNLDFAKAKIKKIIKKFIAKPNRDK